MAKKAYIGVNGVARKVKKGYVGVVSDYTTGVSVAQSALSFGTCAGYTVANLNAAAPIEWNEAAGKFQFTAGTTTTTYASSTVWCDKFSEVIGGSVAGCSWAISEEDPTVYWEYYSYGDYDDNFNKFYRKPGTTAVARKIKKAYIGVGGVARPCWSGGELAYYGVVSGSRYGAYDAKGTSVGNYALFGGGRVGTGWDGLIKNVICVSGSLTDTAVSSLDKVVINHAAGSIGNYALFMGGCIGSASYQKTVTAYSASLTKSAATALASARGEIGAANVGEYLLCGSGIYYDYAYEFAKDVDVYNASLTKTTTNTAIVGSSVAGQTPSYAIFTPTDRASSATTCDAFNASLTRTQKISFLHNHPSASASVGNYAIFMGHNNNRYFDAVDDSLTAHMTPLPTSVTNVTYFTGMGGASIGDYALFAGGYTESVVSKAFSVDASLTIQVQPSLRFARQYLAAAVIKGEKALFYGGKNDSTVYDTIDVYTV